MTNKKGTKRALLMSALSLLLCMSMLVGTTFAWFTDEVSTLNNKIVAGNLDVELEYHDGNGWKKVTETTNLFEENTLWEPGHTEVIYLKVSNLGTLALKYALNINIASEIESINVDGKPFALSDYIYCDVIDGVTEPFANREAALQAAQNAAPIATRLKDVNLNGHRSGNLYPVGDTTGASEKYVCLVVYMPYTVGNEANYRTGEVTPEITLGVNLMATQMTHEEDSWNDQYDANAKYDGVPPFATVTVVSDMPTVRSATSGKDYTLNTAYVFETTETYNEAQLSAYRYWVADFVAYFDHYVDDAAVGLAGQYDTFSPDWLAFELGGLGDIAANTPIRMLGTAGFSINYEELCLGVQRFQCGAYAVNPAHMAGKTMTVELRIFETRPFGHEAHTLADGTTCNGDTKNCETGHSIAIGTYSYTFPAYEVSNSEELAAAVNAGTLEIMLTEGEYTLPTTLENVSLIAEGNVVANVANNNTVNLGENVSLKGIIFSNSATNENGVVKATGANINIEDCTFDLVGNSVGVAVNGNGTSVTVKDCAFSGGYKHIGPVAGSDYDVTIDNCTFDDGVYALHLNAVAGDIIVKNSTIGLFNTLFGQENVALNTGVLRFENCNFIYVDGVTNVAKLYRDAEFVNCHFEKGFIFSGGTSNQDSTWTFTDCTYGEGSIKDHILNDSFDCTITAIFDDEAWDWNKTAKTWTKQ